MKPLITLISGLLVCLQISCISFSKEDKAKSSISKYIKQNFKEPDRYEAIAYGPLEIRECPLDEDENYIQMLKKQQSMVFSNSKIDSAEILNKEIKNYIVNYKGKPKGFNMEHKFKAVNQLGLFGEYQLRFTLDDDYNVIKID
ncbi:MAG TPA: hypothetical protein VK590_14265 [Saprospiraceae bacterium]|nr:hypothetical protein [Saprospiraceae bacterium]